MSSSQAIVRDDLPNVNVARYSPAGIHVVISPVPSFFSLFL